MKKVAKKVVAQKKVKKVTAKKAPVKVRTAKFRYEIETKKEPVCGYENGKISFIMISKPKIKVL